MTYFSGPRKVVMNLSDIAKKSGRVAKRFKVDVHAHLNGDCEKSFTSTGQVCVVFPDGDAVGLTDVRLKLR